MGCWNVCFEHLSHTAVAFVGLPKDLTSVYANALLIFKQIFKYVQNYTLWHVDAVDYGYTVIGMIFRQADGQMEEF